MPKKSRLPTGFDFFSLSKTEPNARARIRLLALGHLSAGVAPADVALLVNAHHTTIRRLLTNFHKKGLQAIYDEAGRGRKTILPESVYIEAKQAILDAQATRGGGRLTATDIQLLLKEKFEATYAEKSIYTLLKTLGLSWISGRSAHPNRDADAQMAFKKTL
jgi:transposase